MNRTEGMMRMLLNNPLVIVNNATMNRCDFSFKNLNYTLSVSDTQKPFMYVKIDTPYIDEDVASSMNMQLMMDLKSFEGGVVKISNEWQLAIQISDTKDLSESIELQHLMLRSMLALMNKRTNWGRP